MPHNTVKKYWFPAKKYGYGWGLPCTWQVWVGFVLYLAILFAATTTLAKDQNVARFLGIVFLDTTALVIICWLTGEELRWR